MASNIEITIANQRGHKMLFFSPVGYADKIISDQLNNEFIKESDRTSFEFIETSLDNNLDRVIDIALKQNVKVVVIGVSITLNMSNLSLLNIESISFYNCTIDGKLLPILVSVKYLLIGESVKFDISFSQFPSLIDISFLSLKTFKGKILNKLETLEKLVIWYENKKLNKLLPMFPNLQHLEINHGSLVELDLSSNKKAETLSLHYCTKLEKVVLETSIKLKAVVVERCKLLDQSNLGDNVRNWKGV